MTGAGMTAAEGSTAFQEIRFGVDDGLATITLARPERRNALTNAMRGEIRAALRRAAQEARAVLIQAEPPAFCAGQDLEEFRAVDNVEQMLATEYAPFFTEIAEAPLPIIAAINGAAAGAGLHMALAADIAIAGRGAKFASPFAKLALTPAGGGSWFLPRRIGHARAVGFAISGEAIDADTAARWGMIWRVVEDDALAEEARALAQRLAAGPTGAFALTKKLLAASWDSGSLPEQLALETKIQAEAAASADHREGVAAFLEKRRPVFKGE
ncbi:MAG: enoyl-CoA hydratase-related protein [Neomegalonema sp.]|nr:enoyl-CoA hydratase-related protein [Neomegalonema sp.]